MKIRKSGLLYKFLCYADDPSIRTSEEDAAAFVSRFVVACVWCLSISILEIVSACMIKEQPVFFWKGNMHQGSLTKTTYEHLSTAKTYILAILYPVSIFLSVAGLLIVFFGLLWAAVLAERAGWLKYEAAILLAGMLLYVFRRRLPKVEYVD